LRLEEFRHHIIFLEDYDINIARYLVQGCDLWLGTPRQLREASGTSGMKAAINGVINMSILDGWWHEAYTPEIGWAIGGEENYENPDDQDKIESNAIYDILEKEVIPLFYDTGNNGIPRKWIARMKEIMVAVCSQFNTDRMVNDYITHFYHLCSKQYQTLSANDYILTKKQSSWKSYIKQNWSSVRIENVKMEEATELKVGAHIKISAQVFLGSLKPEDVAVEIYEGLLDPHNNSIINAKTVSMNSIESHGNSYYTFRGTILCQSSGLHGYTVRIIPKYEEQNILYESGLITWAN
ncbi:MAG: glycosyltransferase family 1 protein, partial [Actinobacteria bacterium]|nr:glycosyltransferase family 1 protein [Actinomycetota bacterium]